MTSCFYFNYYLVSTKAVSIHRISKIYYHEQKSETAAFPFNTDKTHDKIIEF